MRSCLKAIALSSFVLALAACQGAGGRKPRKIGFFPEPPDPPRIQFLTAFESASEIVPARSSFGNFVFGAEEQSGGIFRQPSGCAMHKGILYVTDTALAAIYVIDVKGQKAELAKAEGRAKLRKPFDLDFSSDDRCYIADGGRRQIVVTDLEFKALKEFGPFSNKSRPSDVAVYKDRLYVMDAGDHLVRVLDRESGKELLSFGRGSKRLEFLTGPTSLDVDDNGYVYVSDSIENRIAVFTKDGVFVRQIGRGGDVVGTFSRLKGLARAGDWIFALDAGFENCQIFDLQGRILMFFGGAGMHPGSMYLPSRIWIGKEGLEAFRDYVSEDFVPEYLMIVTNRYGQNRIAAYALGKSKKFKYPSHEFAKTPPPMSPQELKELMGETQPEDPDDIKGLNPIRKKASGSRN